MKFVFLNRDLLNAALVSDLRKSGHAVFVCSEVREAELVLKLHGMTVSLVFGHEQAGVELISLMKASRRFASLPVVLSHSGWGKADIEKHRKGVEAAQAYLKFPCGDVELLKVFDQVLGTTLSSGGAAAPAPVRAPAKPVSSIAMSAPDQKGTAVILEDATSIYQTSGVQSGESGDIVIDLPIGISEPQFGQPRAFEAIVSTETEPSIKLETGASRSVQQSEKPAVAAPAALAPIDAGSPEGVSSIAISQIDQGLSLTPQLDGDATRVVTPAEDPLAASLAQSVRVEEALPMFVDPAEETDEATVVKTTAVRTAVETIVQQGAVQQAGENTTQIEVHVHGTSEVDAEALAQMPYLQSPSRISPLEYTPPLDNALVPGGAANAPDVETLKRYLLLREQDVLALSAQLKQAKDQVGNLETQLRHERATNSEFAHLVQEQGKRIDTFEKEKEIALEGAQKDMEELRFELKRRTDKAKLLEYQIKEATQETEKLKERVRLDIRKIRSREKELENRLEIMKKDSEALLNGREQKIVELKRKLDLAEFNMDLLQDRLEKEKSLANHLRSKLDRAAQVVRVAGGLLHPSDAGEGESSSEEATRDPAA